MKQDNTRQRDDLIQLKTNVHNLTGKWIDEVVI